MPSKHIDTLDKEQIAAVEASENAIGVLAGPGSGKTRVLANRTRHLLLTHDGSQALLLTFTNKAAAEMKSRALSIGGLDANRIHATTFHGFGATFLRSHGNLVGIDPDFEIVDAEEAEEIARKTASALGIGNQFRRWSNHRLRNFEIPDNLKGFGDAYEAAKRAEGVVDFDDLVYYTAKVFDERQEVAETYGGLYPHILVDEFQDTNPAHFSIVSSLASHAATVSVFADDDQAIMRFAGADAANVQRFLDELSAKTYPLTCNYRCREAIVSKANLLIAADPGCSGRQMRPDKSGGVVDLHRFSNTVQEAQEVAANIAGRVFDQGQLPSSIAVLVRNGPRAAEIVSALLERGVPVTDWRGVAYESAERRMLITCLSALRPKLHSRQASRLAEFMGVELVDERDTHAFIELQAGNAVADELLILRSEAFEDTAPSQLAERAQAAIAAHDADAGERARTLVEAVADFESFDPNFSLDQLMAELALRSGGRPPTQGGGVKVATLHGTKGLQWATVFLVGLEEGKLPDFRAEEEETIPDERRACFVGVCRAEDELLLTYSQYYRTFYQAPSRFLNEMEM